MECDPAVIGAMSQTIHAVGCATHAHAHGIAGVGFEAAHTGQGYCAEGEEISAGLDGLVAHLHAMADAHATAAQLMTTSTSMLTSSDEHTSGQITGAGT